MNFDACGANTAVSGNSLSKAESKLSQIELRVYSRKIFLESLEGTARENMYLKIIIFAK
jgi:hypothetical protein